MNSNSLTGKFLAALPTKTSEKGYLYREFWLDISDNPEYPNTPQFSLGGDRCALVDGLEKGQEIEVFFRVRGRKWEKDGRKGVMTSLEATRVLKIERKSTAFSQPLPPPGVLPESDDDLPF